MVAFSEMIRRPSRTMHQAARYFAPEPRRSSWLGVGSMVCLALTVLALVWMYPEIKRYTNIERM